MIGFLMRDSFAKVTVAMVVGLLAINSYLCVQKKAKEAQVLTLESQVYHQQQANELLHIQLEQANRQVETYLQQTKALQEKVLSQLEQSQVRKNAIKQQLQQHQNWADQPVPNGVSQLFNGQGRASKANATSLPDGKAVPTPSN